MFQVEKKKKQQQPKQLLNSGTHLKKANPPPKSR